jgi:hypothetical protein
MRTHFHAVANPRGISVLGCILKRLLRVGVVAKRGKKRFKLERRATTSSNKGFEAWGEIFGDEVMAAAPMLKD